MTTKNFAKQSIDRIGPRLKRNLWPVARLVP